METHSLMIELKKFEVWFAIGSQHLYGLQALKEVAVNSPQAASVLDSAPAKISCSRLLPALGASCLLCFALRAA
jgi:L-arabinose isomerase